MGSAKDRDEKFPRGDSPDSESEKDALESFLENQAEKCSVHNRAQTDEVQALIRKYRKPES